MSDSWHFDPKKDYRDDFEDNDRSHFQKFKNRKNKNKKNGNDDYSGNRDKKGRKNNNWR